MVDDMQKNEHSYQRNFILFSTIPIALCISFSLFYSSSNPDTGLSVLGFGLILTVLVCPLYLSTLCCYCTIKKSLRLGRCVAVCLFMNVITNLTLVIVLSVTTGWSGAMVIWMLPFLMISMLVIGIFLSIVKLIKRRHDKRNIRRV